MAASSNSGLLRGANSTSTIDTSVVNSTTFFTGGVNTHLLPMDPFVTGFGFFKWIKLPTWFKAQFPYFEVLTEKMLKDFNGNDNIEVSPIGVQNGLTQNESQFMGQMGSKGSGVTMTFNEYSGLPFITANNYWVSCIRDPHSGFAIYPTLEGGGGEYSARNHSGELLYVVLRPDVKNTGGRIIETATYYTNVVPTRIIRDPFNKSQGTQDSPQVELAFTADRWFGAGVENYAAKVLSSFTSIATLQSENNGNFGDA